jgi:uncharacterized protein (DUF302 family)
LYYTYTINETIDAPFDETVDRVVDGLEDEGFGVLSDIDVQATIREKLDVEFRQYRILGACNTSLAHEGLEEEIELGALLPCNVIVYETDGGSLGISAADPERLLGLVRNPALEPVAGEVADRLERALDTAVAQATA